MGLFDLLFSNPILFFIYILAMIYGITIHEFAHCFVAYKFGDDDQIQNKRLTLNPLAHVDPIGLVTLVFIGIGWGRAAIINPFKIDKQKFKLGMFSISIAGIVVNFVSALLFALVLKLLIIFNLIQNELLVVFISVMIQVNIILAIFNLIPIHPLDGAKILDILLPDRFNNIKIFLEKYGNIILMSILIFGILFNFSIFSYLYNPVINFVYKLFGLM